ncbi:MAG: adenylosuccinate synthase [Actinobacteria bacterium]|nr:adenylosuccinate synthase [Actinomycetota bacterium]
MSNTCVIGLQWGDEGKGKIVDALAAQHELVVRYCGGANAGHSVTVGPERFALHLIPSGILFEQVLCVIGTGVALDLETLLQEIEGLQARGVKVEENLKISDRAHLVMPYHKLEDELAEQAASGSNKLGTTKRGIGPCYTDRAARRWGIRLGEVYSPESFRDKLAHTVEHKNRIFKALYGAEALDVDEIFASMQQMAQRLEPHVVDATALLNDAAEQGRSILFEGAQGSLLDLDHGTYPYVTSSNCSVAGVSAGTGVPFRSIDRIIGILKAYCTRVGAGPFPSELHDSTSEFLRERGHEYGTTTGRPRRCGWFDAVAARHTCRINGVDSVAIMLLDVLSGLEEINIVTAYRYQGKNLCSFPAQAEVLDQVEPICETVPGWTEQIDQCRCFSDLPANAQAYIHRLEALLHTQVEIVSVGPDRDATIYI